MEETIAVIGGGPSGMAAALSCAGQLKNGRIVIIEKNDRFGKKLLATGNGRCNMTNINMGADHYHTVNRDVLKIMLDTITVDDILHFFEHIGILCRTEDQGRVYPRSGQASSVLDCLRHALRSAGIQEMLGFDVQDIRCNKKFDILSNNGQKLQADKVIIATGGKSSPTTGSDGWGFQYFINTGHKMQKAFPALVQLKTRGNTAKNLQGIRIKAMVKAYGDGNELAREYGEVQLTAYGISGIPVMNLSWLAAQGYGELVFSLDLFPEISLAALTQMLKKRQGLQIYSDITLQDFLSGMVNKKVGQAVLKLSGIEKLSTKASSLNGRQIAAIAEVLKAFKFQIEGDHGFHNSQATGGGIRLDQFSSHSLESRIAPGIYAAGEVLDVLGDCGGYNLHWSWVSGIIAGRGAGNA